MNLHFDVSAEDFSLAGEASGEVKRVLKKLGIESAIVRKIAIAMYEAEMNMVIHANGGTIDVTISSDKISVVLKDRGPGIPDIELAMKEGYSTATHKIREMGFGAGMGLPNMKRYSDEFEISSQVGEGTQVILTVYLSST
jgi:anti-sigma regulatory factor (Ser/Thr protein kinase)